MGFFSRIFGLRGRNGETPLRTPAQPAVRVFTGVGSPLVKITGTTTHRKDEARAMMRRHGQEGRGYLEIEGRLAGEWVENIKANAIAVMVEGEPIGYLSFGDSKSVDVRAFDRHSIAVQAFSEETDGHLRVEGWAWLAPTLPRWDWSASKRPPMTSDRKAQQRHIDTQRSLRRRAEASSQGAREVDAGRVSGVHFLELIEPIKQAKREGRNELALKLCYAAIEGAERDRMGGTPAPAYTEHAAIVLRKLKRRDEEIEVLERYLRWVPGDERMRHPFMDRIRKVEEIQRREETTR